MFGVEETAILAFDVWLYVKVLELAQSYNLDIDSYNSNSSCHAKLQDMK